MRRVSMLLVLALSSCATIMNGTTQKIGISSSPTGANVSVDNQPRGMTPLFVDLKRKDTHLVRMEKSGFDVFETAITRHTSGWVWGNIIFGGLIGLAVDAISGGIHRLEPEQIHATLSPAS